MLNDHDEVKEKVFDIMLCGEDTLTSIFEEEDNAYRQLIIELGQDEKKEEALARLFISILKKE